MKTLVIMRHAKAEKVAESGEDFDRALSERGAGDAKKIAKALKNDGLEPDIWLVSPAKRTFQTYEAVRSVIDTGRYEPIDSLFDCDVSHLFRTLESYEIKHNTIVIIAHNPGVHDLVKDLLHLGGASPSTMAMFALGYDTAQATVFSFDNAQRWVYETHYRPKDLD